MKKFKIISNVLLFLLGGLFLSNLNAFGVVTCYYSYDYCDTGDCYDINDCTNCQCISIEGTPSYNSTCTESSEQ